MFNFTIFFGDKSNCTVSHKSKEFEGFCNKLAQKHELKKIIFSEQVHGTAGTYIGLLPEPGASPKGDGSTSSPRARLLNPLILSLSKDRPAVPADRVRHSISDATAEAIPSEGWSLSRMRAKDF